ncbi:hypothetical protein [Micromonospora sediminimaris]|uniref:Uncharacterized protein n=1 Tax=Micromonospora sediminimaris TaxID=547162 RepID=A0A9W5UTW9_9ACTN|nr:hypothetical protein [Micromonospora sediminimaris]GIJ35037.1 hypothetical protein Vse01_41850 [Micromonospora sediminimaris]SFD27910.1 hypothetical protein SAMN05216284_11452 [Micromonospora sediminimaris]
MGCEDDDCAHEWHYAPYRTGLGALQRGQGAAAAWLQDQPDHGHLVYTCTGRDTRWDWQVDDRYTYLARLLHDLRLDTAPLVTQLRACGPYRAWPQADPTDHDNQFNLAVGILEVLARRGNTQATETLRGYIRDGVRWIDALSTLACSWPAEWWDDLWETAARRIRSEDAAEVLPTSEPWLCWRGRDPRIDTVLNTAQRSRQDARDRPVDLSATSDAELVALLRAADTGRAVKVSALHQIRRNARPVPELLDAVEQLAAERQAGLFGALRVLGPQVLSAARGWAVDTEHPLFDAAAHLLAEHGDEQDIPAIRAALDRLTDEWCGHDRLTEGLARILASSSSAPHADVRAALIRRLRWLTRASPHSYERGSYLRSLLLLDPDKTTAALPSYLLDCETDVRLLAAQHAPIADQTRRWLLTLRDDPIEEASVRRAANARLNSS